MPPMIDPESDEDEEHVQVSSKETRRQKRQFDHDEENDEEGRKRGGSRPSSSKHRNGRSSKESARHTRSKRRNKTSNKALQGASGGYAWEDEIKRSWDLVTVDDEGDMAALAASIIEARKKRTAQKNITPYQRGIIRTLILVLDCSEAMLEKDMRPNRHAMLVQYSIDFVHEFFDQNPISQIGIVSMRNGLAHMISQVSGNPQDHVDALKSIRKQEPKGNPSLQNALAMSRGLLLPVPPHCTKEVLVIFGALSSTDPGDIHLTCLLYTSPSPRDTERSRMPSSA